MLRVAIPRIVARSIGGKCIQLLIPVCRVTDHINNQLNCLLRQFWWLVPPMRVVILAGREEVGTFGMMSLTCKPLLTVRRELSIRRPPSVVSIQFAGLRHYLHDSLWWLWTYLHDMVKLVNYSGCSEHPRKQLVFLVTWLDCCNNFPSTLLIVRLRSIQ